MNTMNQAHDIPMTQAHCQQCALALTEPQAVCLACDAALAKPHAYLGDGGVLAVADEGAYVCPWCAKRFEMALYLKRASTVRWWQFSTLSPQCPHCDHFLQDTAPTFKRSPAPVLMVPFAIGVGIFMRRWHEWMYLPSIFLILGMWMYVTTPQLNRYNAAIAKPDRFVRSVAEHAMPQNESKL